MAEQLEERWAARLERYPQAVLQQLRGLVIAGGCLLLAAFYADMQMPQIYLLLAGLLLLSVWSACLMWQEQRSAAIANSVALQLAVDGLLLALIFAAIGGASNPAISYLLVPISLAALLLTPKLCFAVTLGYVLIYTALLFLYWPLSSLSPTDHHGTALNAHLIGMWLTFGVSAFVIAGLLNSQVQLARRAKTELQQLREQQLRDENVLAVATLAAGAAHELATPLATIAIGLDEIAQEPATTAPEEVALLQAQVWRCRDALQQLAHTARQHQAGEREQATVPEFLADIQQRWQLLQPSVTLTQNLSGAEGGVALWPLTLKQALLNLLNNASSASEHIVLSGQWDKQQLQIQLRDFGDGIELTVAQSAHRLQDSNRGLGMGLLLTHASIEQAGGELRVFAAPDGGTIAAIRLPLQWEDAP